MIFDLARDFHDAIETMPLTSPRRQQVAVLRDFILDHVLQFGRSPHSLYSQFSVDFRGQPVWDEAWAREWAQHRSVFSAPMIERMNGSPERRGTVRKVDLPFRAHIAAIECLPGGGGVVLASQAGDVALVDARRQLLQSHIRLEVGRLFAVAVSETHVYCQHDSPRLDVLELPTLAHVGAIPLEIEEPRYAAYSSAANLLAVSGREAVQLLSPSGEPLHTIPFPPRVTVKIPYQTNMISFDSEGRHLVIGCQSGDMLMVDVETGAILQNRGYCSEGALSVLFEPCADVVWAGACEGKLVRWNFRTGEAQTWRAGGDAIESLVWLDEGSLLVTGHRSGNIQLWSLERMESLATVSVDPGWIRAMTFPKGSGRLYVGSDNLWLLPADPHELQSVSCEETRGHAADISVPCREVVVGAGAYTQHYPFDHKDRPSVMPVRGLVEHLQQQEGQGDTNTSSSNPWDRTDPVMVTAVTVAEVRAVAFAGTTDGSFCALNLESHQFVSAVFRTGSPITSIACDHAGRRVCFAAGHRLFAFELSANGEIETSYRIQHTNEFKAFALLKFLDEDHILLDCGLPFVEDRSGHWSPGTSVLQIRRFQHLEPVSELKVAPVFGFGAFSTGPRCIYLVENDWRYAKHAYSPLTGELDFKSGRLASIGNREYPIWCLKVKASSADWEFDGVPKRLCSGSNTPPVGLRVCEDAGVVVSLAFDGRLEVWDADWGVRIQEVQLKSGGLAGPVRPSKHNEVVCADSGRGSAHGPESYVLRLTR